MTSVWSCASPSRKIRSRGISTSSKITTASISSKRDRERVVPRVALRRERVAADELEPRRRHRDREADRVLPVLEAQVAAGVDGQLVGERRERCEHARAADEDAVLGVLDLVQRDLAGRLLGLGDRAVDLRVDQRVRERQVVVAHVLLRRRRGSRRPPRCRSAPRRRRARRSTRTCSSGSRACGPSSRRVASAIRFDAARRRSRSSRARRLDVRHVDRLAGVGRVHQERLRLGVLEVEERARGSARRPRASGARDGSVIRSPSSQISRSSLRSPSRNCSPVRAPVVFRRRHQSTFRATVFTSA